MQTKLNHAEAGRTKPGACQRAFSRVDMVVTIGLVGCLAIWFGFGHWGERGRMIRCMGNLRVLGHALHDFASEHDNGLPAAGINLPNVKISWDALVAQYLPARSANSTPEFLACPSDPAPHNGKPRSYAMTGNDMIPEHWPPGGNSPSGVGLWWDNRTVLPLVNSNALKQLELLPALKLSVVPVPADTLLLTELVDPDNTMSSILQTTVMGSSQQRRFFNDDGIQFHQSKFNYLMVDGHVELLSSLQTGSYDGTAGIWTLKSGD